MGHRSCGGRWDGCAQSGAALWRDAQGAVCLRCHPSRCRGPWNGIAGAEGRSRAPGWSRVAREGRRRPWSGRDRGLDALGPRIFPIQWGRCDPPGLGSSSVLRVSDERVVSGAVASGLVPGRARSTPNLRRPVAREVGGAAAGSKVTAAKEFRWSRASSGHRPSGHRCRPHGPQARSRRAPGVPVPERMDRSVETRTSLVVPPAGARRGGTARP